MLGPDQMTEEVREFTFNVRNLKTDAGIRYPSKDLSIQFFFEMDVESKSGWRLFVRKTSYTSKK